MKQIDKRYEKTKSFLLGAIDYEKISKYKYNEFSFDLGRMRFLLDILDNPHHGLNTVHVAGTKGKGSTSIMIATILKEAKLKVGLFTSPHLVNLEERIKINGIDISKQAFCDATDTLRPFIEKERKKDLYLSPTFFETLTAISLFFFKKEAVDIAVMEVGLGGRLDSTNIISPLVSVITSIGFDHTDKLGTTLEEIANEKAGIIKNNIPVVSSPQESESISVIQDTCAKTNSNLIVVGRDIKIEKISSVEVQGQLSNKNITTIGSICDIRTENNHYSDLFVPVLGGHQVENCATAIGATEIAIKNFPEKIKNGLKWKNVVHDGLQLVRCPGRIEVVCQYPLTIVDSAHTVESMRSLKNTIKEYIKPKRITLMFGMSQDKNLEGVLSEILPFVDTVVFSDTGNPRSAKLEHLATILKKICNKTHYISYDIDEALNIATKVTDKSDMICVTGSTFLAGKVKSLLDNKRN